jgi:hypothetical protein
MRHGRAARRSQWDNRWRGLSRLETQRQFVTTLAIASLVVLTALLTGAYVALRSQTLAEEQARLTREASMASAMLSPNVGTLTSSSQAGAELSDRISAMTGDDAALYQYSGQSLIAISAHGVDIVGSPLPPAAQPAVVGACGPVAPVGCHHLYSGVVRAGGVEYAATYAPVFDSDGAFRGALMVATPLTEALTEVNSAMVILTIIGALLALLVIAVGAYRFNRSMGQTLDALQTQLRVVAASTVTMEHAAHATVLASRRQERLARQISDGAHGLDALVTSVNQGYPALRESAGAIWAEVSQPGAAPDPLAVMRLARETTLMATSIGSGMEDARVYSDHISRLMNQVVAQERIAAQGGEATQRAAQELRASIEQVEAILGGRMLRRDENLSPLSVASLPSLPRLDESPQRLVHAPQPTQSQQGSSSVWPSRCQFPSIPPLPMTERLPTLPTGPAVVSGEVRAITPETDENASSTQSAAEPARFGDVSFPRLMKDASTRPLTEESDPANASQN